MIFVEKLAFIVGEKHNLELKTATLTTVTVNRHISPKKKNLIIIADLK